MKCHIPDEEISVDLINTLDLTNLYELIDNTDCDLNDFLLDIIFKRIEKLENDTLTTNTKKKSPKLQRKAVKKGRSSIFESVTKIVDELSRDFIDLNNNNFVAGKKLAITTQLKDPVYKKKFILNILSSIRRSKLHQNYISLNPKPTDKEILSLVRDFFSNNNPLNNNKTQGRISRLSENSNKLDYLLFRYLINKY